MRVGRDWLFVTRHNWRRVAVFSLVLAVPTLSILIPSWIAEARIELLFARSHTGHWNHFMPIAQFAAGASLAYLALEAFRHANQATKMLANFSRTPDEDKTFHEVLLDRLKYDERDKRELVIVHKLFQLCQARRAWVEGHETVLIMGEEVKRAEAVSRAIESAKQHPWFAKHEPGHVFVSPFFKGADQVAMAAALALSLLIHVLATVESFQPLYAPWPLLTIWASWAITLTLLGLGVLLPVYYVLIGRHVLDRISSVAGAAIPQYLLLVGGEDEIEQSVGNALHALQRNQTRASAKPVKKAKTSPVKRPGKNGDPS